MVKEKRHELILKIIAEKEVYGQQELLEELNALGVNVTQATISRDINDLKLIRTDGLTKKYRYAKAYVSTEVSPTHISLLKGIINSVVYSNNLIIIKTHAGSANTVGKIIDEFNFNNVLGTIAGDDTLLMVLVSKTDAEVITQKIKEIVSNA